MSYKVLGLNQQPFLLSQSLVIHWDSNRMIQTVRYNQTPRVSYRASDVSEIEEFYKTVKQLEKQTGRIRVSFYESVGNGVVTFYIHPAIAPSMINFEPFNSYSDGMVYIGSGQKYIVVCFEQQASMCRSRKWNRDESVLTSASDQLLKVNITPISKMHGEAGILESSGFMPTRYEEPYGCGERQRNRGGCTFTKTIFWLLIFAAGVVAVKTVF